MSDNKWLITLQEQGITCGPVTDDVLLKMARKGKVKKDTKLKLLNTGQEALAKNVEGLFKEKPSSEKEFSKPESKSTLSSAKEIVCPHCWNKFSLEKIKHISKHPKLMGDDVLGEETQRRFLASRFTDNGLALDSEGLVCTDMACPKCHLHIPESAIDLPSFFISIVGAPASGKSYFLTSMIWHLRKKLPRMFDYSFTDSDPLINATINEFESLLFLNDSGDELVALPKTELRGGIYDEVYLDGVQMSLPSPYIFNLNRLDAGDESSDNTLSRNIVFYDNAGEHFQPGQDNIANPGTMHLIHSDGLIFLFDPSRDSRFRKFCNSKDPQVQRKEKLSNQETLLSEMTKRIRRNTGMKTNEKYQKPLVIAVAKFDMLSFADFNLEKWKPYVNESKTKTKLLDYDAVSSMSYAMRNMLFEICPEFISTAESFASRVFYIPFSALGHTPLELEGGGIGVLPEKIKPMYCELPFFILLAEKGFLKWQYDLYREIDALEITDYDIKNGIVRFLHPETDDYVTLPESFAGTTVYDSIVENWIRVPGQTALEKSENEEADNSFWDE